MTPEGGYFFFQNFEDSSWQNKFFISKSENYTGKWEVKHSETPQAISGEKLLLMTEANAYYGIAAKFDSPLDVTGQSLVVQYEVRFQDNIECGGAYMKLFGNENFVYDKITNETKYVIMFGPDKCGITNKVHFIFRHRNPKTGEFEEKHHSDPALIKSDKISHLYTLIVRPDNTFEILIDGDRVKHGSLMKDFEPPVEPPKEIDDPTDIKPSDWIDEEMMKDPNAKKPEDWDENEPEYIPDTENLEPPSGWLTDEPKFVVDPEAKKPDDWDDDIHGEWEPPTIPNPKCEDAPGCGEYEPPAKKNPAYKGKWKAPLIKNPAYKGVWKARQIKNPNFFQDLHPHNFRPLHGFGFELWMVNKNVGFNNIWIGTDEAAVYKWNKAHFIPKHEKQEALQKKLEPKETKEGEQPEGFVGEVKNTLQTLQNAVLKLYKENAAMTVVLGIVIVLIPIFICFFACFKKSPPPPPRRQQKTPAHSAPSQTHNSEESPTNPDDDDDQGPKVVEIQSPSQHDEDQAVRRKEAKDNYADED